jgi:hypothetical protein
MRKELVGWDRVQALVRSREYLKDYENFLIFSEIARKLHPDQKGNVSYNKNLRGFQRQISRVYKKAEEMIKQVELSARAQAGEETEK